MLRVLKWIGIGIGALVIVLLLVVSFFPWNRLRGPISRTLSADLHRQVNIAALQGSLFWHPHVQVSGLSISNPAWAGGGQMLSIQRLDVQLRFWPLLRGELVLPKVALIRPIARLYRAADGRANWELVENPQSGKAKKQANEPLRLPLVHRLFIQSGQLSARDELRKITFDGRSSRAAKTAPRQVRHRLRPRPSKPRP